MEPFNALDKKNLAISIAQALLTQSLDPLPPKKPFAGAGIYALYYTGTHKPYPLYESVSIENRPDHNIEPIYVGKAVPPGIRVGGSGLHTPSRAILYHRLREHAASIQQVSNLSLDDFLCQYLVVDDIWISLGESLLIEKFSPIWNTILVGFGNHDPGKGRYNQQRSPWDTLHPGRTWADKLQPNTKSAEQIAEEVRKAIANRMIDQ